MAEGLLRAIGGDRFQVMSAGAAPAAQVSPYAIEVMAEIGIDISQARTKSIQSVQNESFDWVITLCDWARQACPIFRSKNGAAKRLHWSVPDPIDATGTREEILKVYRDARDLIARQIREWLKKEFDIGPEISSH